MDEWRDGFCGSYFIIRCFTIRSELFVDFRGSWRVTRGEAFFGSMFLRAIMEYTMGGFHSMIL